MKSQSTIIALNTNIDREFSLFETQLSNNNVNSLKSVIIKFKNILNTQRPSDGNSIAHLILENSILTSLQKYNLLNNLNTSEITLEVPNYRNIWPIHLAAATMNTAIIEFFKNNYTDLNRKDTNGDTPLHYIFKSIDFESEINEEDQVFSKDYLKQSQTHNTQVIDAVISKHLKQIYQAILTAIMEPSKTHLNKILSTINTVPIFQVNHQIIQDNKSKQYSKFTNVIEKTLTLGGAPTDQSMLMLSSDIWSESLATIKERLQSLKKSNNITYGYPTPFEHNNIDYRNILIERMTRRNNEEWENVQASIATYLDNMASNNPEYLLTSESTNSINKINRLTQEIPNILNDFIHVPNLNQHLIRYVLLNNLAGELPSDISDLTATGTLGYMFQPNIADILIQYQLLIYHISFINNSNAIVAKQDQQLAKLIDAPKYGLIIPATDEELSHPQANKHSYFNSLPTSAIANRSDILDKKHITFNISNYLSNLSIFQQETIRQAIQSQAESVANYQNIMRQIVFSSAVIIQSFNSYHNVFQDGYKIDQAAAYPAFLRGLEFVMTWLATFTINRIGPSFTLIYDHIDGLTKTNYTNDDDLIRLDNNINDMMEQLNTDVFYYKSQAYRSQLPTTDNSEINDDEDYNSALGLNGLVNYQDAYNKQLDIALLLDQLIEPTAPAPVVVPPEVQPVQEAPAPVQEPAQGNQELGGAPVIIAPLTLADFTTYIGTLRNDGNIKRKYDRLFDVINYVKLIEKDLTSITGEIYRPYVMDGRMNQMIGDLQFDVSQFAINEQAKQFANWNDVAIAVYFPITLATICSYWAYVVGIIGISQPSHVAAPEEEWLVKLSPIVAALRIDPRELRDIRFTSAMVNDRLIEIQTDINELVVSGLDLALLKPVLLKVLNTFASMYYDNAPIGDISGTIAQFQSAANVVLDNFIKLNSSVSYKPLAYVTESTASLISNDFKFMSQSNLNNIVHSNGILGQLNLNFNAFDSIVADMLMYEKIAADNSILNILPSTPVMINWSHHLEILKSFIASLEYDGNYMIPSLYQGINENLPDLQFAQVMTFANELIDNINSYVTVIFNTIEQIQQNTSNQVVYFSDPHYKDSEFYKFNSRNIMAFNLHDMFQGSARDDNRSYVIGFLDRKMASLTRLIADTTAQATRLTSEAIDTYTDDQLNDYATFFNDPDVQSMFLIIHIINATQGSGQPLPNIDGVLIILNNAVMRHKGVEGLELIGEPLAKQLERQPLRATVRNIQPVTEANLRDNLPDYINITILHFLLDILINTRATEQLRFNEDDIRGFLTMRQGQSLVSKLREWNTNDLGIFNADDDSILPFIIKSLSRHKNNARILRGLFVGHSNLFKNFIIFTPIDNSQLSLGNVLSYENALQQVINGNSKAIPSDLNEIQNYINARMQLASFTDYFSIYVKYIHAAVGNIPRLQSIFDYINQLTTTLAFRDQLRELNERSDEYAANLERLQTILTSLQPQANEGGARIIDQTHTLTAIDAENYEPGDVLTARFVAQDNYKLLSDQLNQVSLVSLGTFLSEIVTRLTSNSNIDQYSTTAELNPVLLEPYFITDPTASLDPNATTHIKSIINLLNMNPERLLAILTKLHIIPSFTIDKTTYERDYSSFSPYSSLNNTAKQDAVPNPAVPLEVNILSWLPQDLITQPRDQLAAACYLYTSLESAIISSPADLEALINGFIKNTNSMKGGSITNILRSNDAQINQANIALLLGKIIYGVHATIPESRLHPENPTPIPTLANVQIYMTNQFIVIINKLLIMHAKYKEETDFILNISQYEDEEGIIASGVNRYSRFTGKLINNFRDILINLKDTVMVGLGVVKRLMMQYEDLLVKYLALTTTDTSSAFVLREDIKFGEAVPTYDEPIAPIYPSDDVTEEDDEAVFQSEDDEEASDNESQDENDEGSEGEGGGHGELCGGQDEDDEDEEGQGDPAPVSAPTSAKAISLDEMFNISNLISFINSPSYKLLELLIYIQNVEPIPSANLNTRALSNLAISDASIKSELNNLQLLQQETTNANDILRNILEQMRDANLSADTLNAANITYRNVQGFVNTHRPVFAIIENIRPFNIFTTIYNNYMMIANRYYSMQLLHDTYSPKPIGLLKDFSLFPAKLTYDSIAGHFQSDSKPSNPNEPSIANDPNVPRNRELPPLFQFDTDIIDYTLTYTNTDPLPIPVEHVFDEWLLLERNKLTQEIADQIIQGRASASTTNIKDVIRANLKAIYQASGTSISSSALSDKLIDFEIYKFVDYVTLSIMIKVFDYAIIKHVATESDVDTASITKLLNDIPANNAFMIMSQDNINTNLNIMNPILMASTANDDATCHDKVYYVFDAFEYTTTSTYGNKYKLNLDAVKALSTRYNLNTTNNNGESVLYGAVDLLNADLVKLLIELGSKVTTAPSHRQPKNNLLDKLSLYIHHDYSSIGTAIKPNYINYNNAIATNTNTSFIIKNTSLLLPVLIVIYNSYLHNNIKTYHSDVYQQAIQTTGELDVTHPGFYDILQVLASTDNADLYGNKYMTINSSTICMIKDNKLAMTSIGNVLKCKLMNAAPTGVPQSSQVPASQVAPSSTPDLTIHYTDTQEATHHINLMRQMLATTSLQADPLEPNPTKYYSQVLPNTNNNYITSSLAWEIYLNTSLDCNWINDPQKLNRKLIDIIQHDSQSQSQDSSHTAITNISKYFNVVSAHILTKTYHTSDHNKQAIQYVINTLLTPHISNLIIVGFINLFIEHELVTSKIQVNNIDYTSNYQTMYDFYNTITYNDKTIRQYLETDLFEAVFNQIKVNSSRAYTNDDLKHYFTQILDDNNYINTRGIVAKLESKVINVLVNMYKTIMKETYFGVYGYEKWLLNLNQILEVLLAITASSHK